MTVMGDALMDELSDRGSIPLRSIDRPSVYVDFKGLYVKKVNKKATKTYIFMYLYVWLLF